MRKSIERLVEIVGQATCWLALVIVVLMACNVILRYTLSFGSVWAQELEWHLLVPLIMFGMSYALLKGEHVRVDVLYAKFKPKTQLWIELVSQALAMAICAFVIWLSLAYVQQSFVIGEQSSDPGGLPYRWALKALIPMGFVLFFLQSLAAAMLAWEQLSNLGKEAS
jgi:TRAP-type mannitol/chloroaromatic compound transport system permease small subunit